MKKILSLLFVIIISVLVAAKVYTVSANTDKQNCVEYEYIWKHDFTQYMNNNDMEEKVKNLKDGLDKISQEYVDQFMKNSKFWHKCINQCKDYKEDDLWSKYDKKLFAEFKKIEVPADYNHNQFIYKNIYGLRDLPETVLKGINGKDIIDIGAAPGDTAYTFHKYFPKSKIYAFEPLGDFIGEIHSTVDDLENYTLIRPIKKAVGEKEDVIPEMAFGDVKSYNVLMVSLDNEYKKIGNNNLGLIKMDVEGAESSIIKGAENVIKKYKPVLAVAIYHRGEDFFEMKDKLKKLNPKYNFMIRRSEDAKPDSDLVLIAY